MWLWEAPADFAALEWVHCTSCLMKELKVHLTVCTLQQGGYCTDIITKLRTFFYTEKYHIFVGELQGRY